MLGSGGDAGFTPLIYVYRCVHRCVAAIVRLHGSLCRTMAICFLVSTLNRAAVLVRLPACFEQSLTLWRDIMHDMFRLWCLGEEDLLSESFAYKLVDTGQGKQRVQNSPQTFKAMQVQRCVRFSWHAFSAGHTRVIHV